MFFFQCCPKVFSCVDVILKLVSKMYFVNQVLMEVCFVIIKGTQMKALSLDHAFLYKFLIYVIWQKCVISKIFIEKHCMLGDNTYPFRE